MNGCIPIRRTNDGPCYLCASMDCDCNYYPEHDREHEHVRKYLTRLFVFLKTSIPMQESELGSDDEDDALLRELEREMGDTSLNSILEVKFLRDQTKPWKKKLPI